jgi:hypothetical protein
VLGHNGVGLLAPSFAWAIVGLRIYRGESVNEAAAVAQPA